jgi:hypothetical protein
MKTQLIQLLAVCWLVALAAFLLAVRYERPQGRSANQL